jgi:hypothetical protein
MSGFEFLLDKSGRAPESAVLPGPGVDVSRKPSAMPAHNPVERAAVRAVASHSTLEMATLDLADRELLNALAAYLIRYGKSEEALAFLDEALAFL